MEGALASQSNSVRLELTSWREQTFPQEGLDCGTNTSAFTGLLRSPLESPSRCSVYMTRMRLCAENGNSCGEGRQEEPAQITTLGLLESLTSWAPTVNLTGSERRPLFAMRGMGLVAASPTWELLSIPLILYWNPD